MKDKKETITEAIRKAAEKAIKVEKTPDPPKPKENKKGEPFTISEYYEKPRLWLDSKDYAGVRDMKGGEEVYLAVKAKVASYNSSENIDSDGKKTDRVSVTLEILEIANITDIKGK